MKEFYEFFNLTTEYCNMKMDADSNWKKTRAFNGRKTNNARPTQNPPCPAMQNPPL